MATPSSYVSALDNFTPKKYGENGNAEYEWSPEINEKFTQIYLQNLILIIYYMKIK